MMSSLTRTKLVEMQDKAQQNMVRVETILQQYIKQVRSTAWWHARRSKQKLKEQMKCFEAAVMQSVSLGSRSGYPILNLKHRTRKLHKQFHR